ncbi:MAG TPA: hypothetical protein VKU89_04790 [Solirubrobacteraceae bacterium]|nr:hypothetical protein [Solirubrobacteraceae bacterium]
MELALALRELLGHRRALIAGLVVAALGALLSVYRFDGLSLKPRGLRYATAATSVFVDTSSSVLGNVGQSFEPLQSRASAYANFMASPTILQMIGAHVGIAGDRLYAAGPVDPSVPRIIEEPTAVERNVEITGETDPYRLNFNSDPNMPTIGIYAQAPTRALATALANAAATSLDEYVTHIESEQHVPPRQRVVVRALGSAIGGTVDGGVAKTIAAMTFIAILLAWCIGILIVARFAAHWRASATLANDGRGHRGGGSQSGRAPDAASEKRRRQAKEPPEPLLGLGAGAAPARTADGGRGRAA